MICTEKFHESLFMSGIKMCPICKKPIHNEVTVTVTSTKINMKVTEMMKAISEMVAEQIPEGIRDSSRMHMFQINFLSATMQITSRILEQACTSIAWSMAEMKKDMERKN